MITINFHLAAHPATTVEAIMATLQEVRDALQLAADTAAEERAEVLAKLEILTQQIADLQAQIAAGSAASPEDLDGLLATVQGLTASIEGITE